MKPKFCLGALGAIALANVMNPVTVDAKTNAIVQLWQVVPEGQGKEEGVSTAQIMNALQCRPNHNLYKVTGGKSEHNTYVNSCYVDDALYLGDIGNGYRVYVAGYEGSVPKSESHYFNLDLDGNGKTVRYEIQTIARLVTAPNTAVATYDNGYDEEVQILETTSDYLTKMHDVEDNIELFSIDEASSYSLVEEKASYQVKTPSYYRSVNGELQHLLTNNVWGDTYSATIVGRAPSWMKDGVKYYSYDGVYFYSDWRDIAVDGSGAINETNPFYNYYQWLPFRSSSNMNASNFNDFVKQRGYTSVPSSYPASGTQSKLVNTGSIFQSVQSDYGINGALQFAMGIHESGWGRSSLSINKNNLFGMNATDNNPYGNGTTFPTVEAGIDYHADRYLSWGYTDPLSDARFFGSHVGNKGSGMNVKYASDPFWGEKIAGWYYRIDKQYGYKDYNYYSIGIKSDNGNYNVRNQASLSGALLYMTKNGKSNIRIREYPFLLIGQSGDYYKIQSDTPIVGGVAKYSGQYKFKDSVAYVSKDAVTTVNNKNYKIPAGQTTSTPSTPSSNANLSTLKTNVGTLSPSFSPSKTSYTINLDATVTSITLSGTLEDAGAKVVSGLGKHSLKVGTNTIHVKTQAQNGATKTYTITVNVTYPESMTSARFSKLTTSLGKFSPSFSPTTTSYKITLPENASSIKFSGTLESSTAKVISGLGTHSLKAGTNTISIKTQNELGWPLTYTIQVENPKPVDDMSARFSKLTTSAGKFSPSFKPTTTEYTITLDKYQSSIKFSGALESSAAKVVSGLGTHKLSGGTNVIKIKTENGLGWPLTYTITVKNPQTTDEKNARLSTITYNRKGTLSPAYRSDQTNYTLKLSDYATSITFAGELEAKGAKVVSGLGKHSLKVGTNTIKIKTQAKNGWPLTYTIKVVVPEKSSNARLKDLKLSAGKISPTFSPTTTDYTVTMPVGSRSITVNSSGLQHSGAKVISGLGKHTLKVGTNKITIKTQAQNGWYLYYKLTVKVPS